MGLRINVIKQYAKLCGEKSILTKPIKSINVGRLKYVPLQDDILKLSERAQFEKRLHTSFQTEPLTISADGAEAKWSMFKHSQYGSQDAFWAKNELSGELFYIKIAEDAEKEGHIESEILANKLYNLAGIETPEVLPVVINGKTKGLASKYVESLEEAKRASQLKSSFAADAWLANWDTTAIGNTYIRDGRLVKLDNGGALRYRAMGELKPNFGDKVEELISFVSHKDWISTEVYSSLTHQELVHSFEQVCNISDKAILETVADKELAQTLINRRNYMRDILNEIKETPRKDGNLAQYFTKLSDKVSKKYLFSSEKLSEILSENLNKQISDNGAKAMPCSIDLAQNLVNEIKNLEQNGVKITKKDILKFLQETIEDGLDIRAGNAKGYIDHICAMEEFYTRMFINLSAVAKKTPLKQDESISDFVSRIIKIQEQRQEASRIKRIKSKLHYEPDTIVKPRALTQRERDKAIKQLEEKRKQCIYLNIKSKMPKLDKDSPDSDILLAWQRAHLGGFTFTDKKLQEAVMQVGGRYNSKHPGKFRKTSEYRSDRNYKQVFDIEPVYHWTSSGNGEEFAKDLPTGSIFELDTRLCCSIHKTFGESDYGDHVTNLNIKFIIHPKSETSRAYSAGFNQEVVYPIGEKFRVLDNECIEYIDPVTGCGYPRWEIHMQEV